VLGSLTKVRRGRFGPGPRRQVRQVGRGILGRYQLTAPEAGLLCSARTSFGPGRDQVAFAAYSAESCADGGSAFDPCIFSMPTLAACLMPSYASGTTTPSTLTAAAADEGEGQVPLRLWQFGCWLVILLFRIPIIDLRVLGLRYEALSVSRRTGALGELEPSTF
jgi:hypothetical protein